MALSYLTCRLGFFVTVIIFLFAYLLYHDVKTVNADTDKDNDFLLPTVVIATLVRNKEHTLPWFLGLLEKLDYPKDRMSLW